MMYIVLYSEEYGYFESMHDNYTHHTHDSHKAAKYIYLDSALRIRNYLKSKYDEDYHIELISEEG